MDGSMMIYFKTIERIPTLSPTEENDLIELIKNGDILAKNKLFVSSLNIVIIIVRKFIYINSNIPILKLILAGNIGLNEAINTFDCKKNAEFSNYAYEYIKYSITNAIN
jgi:DNA-directed RNA polymerase sigma subunit (sigma70/sigma32)